MAEAMAEIGDLCAGLCAVLRAHVIGSSFAHLTRSQLMGLAILVSLLRTLPTVLKITLHIRIAYMMTEWCTALSSS